MHLFVQNMFDMPFHSESISLWFCDIVMQQYSTLDELWFLYCCTIHLLTHTHTHILTQTSYFCFACTYTMYNTENVYIVFVVISVHNNNNNNIYLIRNWREIVCIAKSLINTSRAQTRRNNKYVWPLRIFAFGFPMHFQRLCCMYRRYIGEVLAGSPHRKRETKFSVKCILYSVAEAIINANTTAKWTLRNGFPRGFSVFGTFYSLPPSFSYFVLFSLSIRSLVNNTNWTKSLHQTMCIRTKKIETFLLRSNKIPFDSRWPSLHTISFRKSLKTFSAIANNAVHGKHTY